MSGPVGEHDHGGWCEETRDQEIQEDDLEGCFKPSLLCDTTAEGADFNLSPREPEDTVICELAV